MNLYITHCTYKKDDSLKITGTEVTPDKLYVGIKIQRFMKKCKGMNVRWAIFSDYYGVWFSNEKHKWYEKHPNDVTNEEFNKLLNEAESKLKNFDTVYFYGNYKSRYFHTLYRKLVDTLKKSGINIVLISHLTDIV